MGIKSTGFSINTESISNDLFSIVAWEKDTQRVRSRLYLEEIVRRLADSIILLPVGIMI